MKVIMKTVFKQDMVYIYGKMEINMKETLKKIYRKEWAKNISRMVDIMKGNFRMVK